MSEAMPGRYPAIVKSYDKITRTCRVEIPGITSGSDSLLLAEIEYPIGDKTRDTVLCTEIEIFENDTVWVSFIGGDSRYPVITGWRNPQSGNGVDWRRWHHANIELTADGVMKLNATTIQLNAENIEITSSADTVINADNTIINADTDINGGTLTHNSKSISDSHTHLGVQAGSGITGVPT
jgi:hypothetical protein